MYVVPQRRGEGLSRHLLAALETAAADLGWNRLRLETGPLQVEAIGLYGRSGYVRIDPFGAYVGSADSLCFEKKLAPRSQQGPPGGIEGDQISGR